MFADMLTNLSVPEIFLAYRRSTKKNFISKDGFHDYTILMEHNRLSESSVAGLHSDNKTF